MRISRENYEIWFIDWLDNNLTGSQAEELNSFLDENPDLQEEFNDLCVLNLRPTACILKGKEKLLRSSSDLPEKQLELLCAAAAENDLDEEQQKDLDEILSLEPEKIRTFEIYKRLRLKAPEISYHNKRKLFRLSAVQKVYRVAWTGLSAAAVVAIILMTGVLNRSGRVEDNTTIALKKTTPVPQTDKNTVGENKNQTLSEKTELSVRKKTELVSENRQSKPVEPENEIEKVSAPEKVNITVPPAISESLQDNSLVAVNISIKPFTENDPDDGRSNIGRFIAQRFRSKVLDESAPSDKPLKGYEIAEAGIEGLNKLLGWQMALTTKNDDKGEVTSVNFNSRMLKFNTPVKNNGSSE